MELCRKLRWKGFHGKTWGSAEALKLQALKNDVPCSCLQTGQPWGPDEDIVGFLECSSERACFETSPVGPPKVA